MKAIWLLPLVLQLVLASSEESGEDSSEEDIRDYWALQTIISKMDIKTEIANRYATTTVESYVNNPKHEPHGSNFTVVLPNQAFISKFVMEVGGKEYAADISEKDVAKNKYLRALENGQTAGHIFARDTNTFMVAANVEPRSEVKFFLTYEELLERKNSQYELIINIFPGQIVDELKVKVQISESRPLDFVKTPLIRSGDRIEEDFNENLDSQSTVTIQGKTAVVDFTPSRQKQRIFATELGRDRRRGMAGQFIVNYDVKRGRRGSELLVQDNFFACFLSMDRLPPLPKHIVFVLDSSGSMDEEVKGANSKEPSTKLELMQDAMEKVLKELQPNDLFNIIQFSTNSYVLDFDKNQRRKIRFRNYRNPYSSLDTNVLAKPFSKSNVEEAITILKKFSSTGGTNIISGLETALATIDVAQKQPHKIMQPIIMFLTDGIPNVGIKETEKIVEIITKLNHHKVPIYTLSFGEKTNQEFLGKLSAKNQGKTRHIYEASDASLQLQEFYNEISIPLLKDVQFFHKDKMVNISKTNFPVLFKGSELSVCGYYDGTEIPVNMVTIKAVSNKGNNDDDLDLQPVDVEPSVTSLERLCAFLTTKQKLTDGIALKNDQLTKQGLDLAFKYSFVTDLTSLVVVKPKASLRNTVPDFVNRFKQEFPDRYSSTKESEELQALKEDLPWLTKIVETKNTGLDSNTTLKIKQKTYCLGEKHTTKSTTSCPVTPLGQNSKGICKLLLDCPEVWDILTNYQTYQQYFCEVDKQYAGVCCPEE